MQASARVRRRESISDHGLSARIPASRTSGRGRSSLSSASISVRTPAGLWATSSTQVVPRMRSTCNRPDQRTAANPRSTSVNPGWSALGRRPSSSAANSALRAWCPPGSGSRSEPLPHRCERKESCVPSIPVVTSSSTAISSSTTRGVPARSASARSTASTCGCSSPVSAGTPLRKIPPFSRAISTSDSPRYSIWSRAMLVTAVATGESTFVASSRPPRPTSTTATSTPASARQRNAMAVVASKKEAPVRSMAGRSRSAASSSATSSMGRPSTRIRSVKEIR